MRSWEKLVVWKSRRAAGSRKGESVGGVESEHPGQESWCSANPLQCWVSPSLVS